MSAGDPWKVLPQEHRCVHSYGGTVVYSAPPKRPFQIPSHWGDSALTLNRGRACTWISISQSLVHLRISQALTAQNTILGRAEPVSSSPEDLFRNAKPHSKLNRWKHRVWIRVRTRSAHDEGAQGRAEVYLMIAPKDVIRVHQVASDLGTGTELGPPALSCKGAETREP